MKCRLKKKVKHQQIKEAYAKSQVQNKELKEKVSYFYPLKFDFAVKRSNNHALPKDRRKPATEQKNRTKLDAADYVFDQSTCPTVESTTVESTR